MKKIIFFKSKLVKKATAACFIVLILSGNSRANSANDTSFNSIQTISNGDRLCVSVGDELLKEMLKQTIYTVGTKVLNKYANTNPRPLQNQGSVQQQTIYTSEPQTVYQTQEQTTQQTYTPNPEEEQMIIVR